MTRKRKKHKFKFKFFLLFLLFLLVIIYIVINVLNYKVRNIYIMNNEIYSDNEIIKNLNLDNSPFLLTTNYSINKKSNELPLIKQIKLNRKLPATFEIDIEEHHIYFIYNDLYYILDDKLSKDEINKELAAPILVDVIEENLISKFHEAYEKIDKEIVTKISQIEYAPTEYDEERFLFIMSDGNYSYVSILNIENINYYNKIVTQLEGKKSILYFDSYRENDAGIITETLD